MEGVQTEGWDGGGKRGVNGGIRGWRLGQPGKLTSTTCLTSGPSPPNNCKNTHGYGTHTHTQVWETHRCGTHTGMEHAQASNTQTGLE